MDPGVQRKDRTGIIAIKDKVATSQEDLSWGGQGSDRHGQVKLSIRVELDGVLQELY